MAIPKIAVYYLGLLTGIFIFLFLYIMAVIFSSFRTIYNGIFCVSESTVFFSSGENTVNE